MNNICHDFVQLLHEIVHLVEEFCTCNCQGIFHLGNPTDYFWQLKFVNDRGDSLAWDDSGIAAWNGGGGATLRKDTSGIGTVEVD